MMMVSTPRSKIQDQAKEARDGGKESFTGGAVGGEPEGDISDGFGEMKDFGLQKQLDI